MRSMELTVRQKIDVIMRVISIFLLALLLFSIGFGGIKLVSVVPALSITYLSVHYWQRFLIKKKKTF